MPWAPLVPVGAAGALAIAALFWTFNSCWRLQRRTSGDVAVTGLGRQGRRICTEIVYWRQIVASWYHYPAEVNLYHIFARSEYLKIIHGQHIYILKTCKKCSWDFLHTGHECWRKVVVKVLCQVFLMGAELTKEISFYHEICHGIWCGKILY